MRCYRGDPDVEMQGQTCDKAEVKASSEKEEKKTSTDQVQEYWIRTILQPKGLLLVLCVISIAVDPLFFYLPVINEERKCVALDRRLYIITICLRTVLDSISLVNIIWKCFHLSNYIDKKARLLQEQNGALPSKDDRSKAKRRYLWSLANEVLAILPFPQVLIGIIFAKLKGSQSLNVRKVLTAVILFQYLPRALRIFPTWKKVFIHRNPSSNLPKRVIVVKATFNLLLYIVASHVLGGVWYFLSVERETACWHLACKNHIECDRSSFDCSHGFGNYTFLNDSCPIDAPNTTVFDFGIFQAALQSGTVASMDFPRKTLYCFWWGLRNLSSFGSNLQTSTSFWENCFSVLTSILGLLLFICFIGHLQMYMQWGASIELEKAMIRKLEQWDEAKKFVEKKKRRKYDMKIKILKIHGWINRNPRLIEKRKLIMSGVSRMFEENKDIDAENPLPHLPMSTRIEILHHLCVPLLQKVPMLQDKELSARMICMNLKPLYFNEHTYIFREGEPIDMMLLITQGIVLKFPITTKSSGETVEYIEQGDFYGIELLQWAACLESSCLSNLPISTNALKTRTKVEAFGLMAKDVKALLSSSKIKEESASTMQSAWRHHFLTKRKEKKHEDKSWCQEYCFNCLRFRRSSS